MEMEIKDDDDGNEGQSSPQVWDWNHISEEAVKMANEYLGSGAPSPERKVHRRSQSEAGGSRHRRRNSFQSLKHQLSRAWRWGGNSHSDNGWINFNPEVLADQKRQWYQLHTPDRTKYQEPTALFEHFIVTGLHPDANLETVEAAFAGRKKWLSEAPRSNGVDGRSLYYRGPTQPSLDPQLIFKYPPAKKLPMRQKDLCAFTFPGGVKARLLERTPSMSDLNSLVYGQEHLRRDDLAFVFSFKAADNGTLYGVCLQVPEIVQRPPAILGCSSPLCHPSGGCCRFLVTAPRCYCLLTRVPFFKLHYEMLNSIIAQERLNRITQFVNEMGPVHYSFSASRSQDDLLDDCEEDWMSMAIPVENAIALSAAAAGIVSEDDPPSASRSAESLSPTSVDASDALEFAHAPDAAETPASDFRRADKVSESGTCSPEAPMLGQSDNKLERSSSTMSMYSSVRSIDDEDGYFSSQESEYSGEFFTMEWAKETKNDMLQVVCAYGAMTIPERGSDIVFQPLKHMQAIHYKRSSVSQLGIDENSLDTDNNPLKFAEMSSRLAAAEEAFALSVWTTATICRVLSLDSILALLTGVLLEKQVVVFCPNLGVLSAVTLSLTPMIRPFEWQSLFLPILPVKMLDFLDAPVPYIVGMQNLPGDMRFKTSNLVQVDVAKDQVKTCSLPLLPRRKQLYNELRPIHAALAGQYRIATKHPVYRCNEVQIKAATCFVDTVNSYLESLCADLRVHSITNVQSNDDRVSLLLKDTFIDSFSSRDRPFIKLFVDTQMFSVLSDSRLATFEHEKFSSKD